MKPNKPKVHNLILAFVASFTLGLAPFYPEPHIIGKLKWILEGGHDKQIVDYADLGIAFNGGGLTKMWKFLSFAI